MPTPSTANSMAYASKELSRIFGEYATWNGRSVPLLLERLAEDLTWDLFYQTAALRPHQQAKIDAVPLDHGYAVKRRLRKSVGTEQAKLRRYRTGPKKGQFKSLAASIRNASDSKHVTIDEEISLRKRFAALFQASGWISSVLNKSRGRKVIRMIPQAVVVKRSDGKNIGISVTNPRPNSQEFAESNGIIEAAAGYRAGRMLEYIRKHAEKGAAALSRKQPTFSGINVSAEVERAMAGIPRAA